MLQRECRLRVRAVKRQAGPSARQFCAARDYSFTSMWDQLGGSQVSGLRLAKLVGQNRYRRHRVRMKLQVRHVREPGHRADGDEPIIRALIMEAAAQLAFKRYAGLCFSGPKQKANSARAPPSNRISLHQRLTRINANFCTSNCVSLRR